MWEMLTPKSSTRSTVEEATDYRVNKTHSDNSINYRTIIIKFIDTYRYYNKYKKLIYHFECNTKFVYDDLNQCRTIRRRGVSLTFCRVVCQYFHILATFSILQIIDHLLFYPASFFCLFIFPNLLILFLFQ